MLAHSYRKNITEHNLKQYRFIFRHLPSFALPLFPINKPTHRRHDIRWQHHHLGVEPVEKLNSL